MTFRGGPVVLSDQHTELACGFVRRQDGPPPKYRDRLPKAKEKSRKISWWSILKAMVGKDLSRICFPVHFNEPLSGLHKIAEGFEYSHFLDLVGAKAHD